MTVLDCTLVSEGPSDVVLIPLLQWLLETHVGAIPAHFEWADLGRLPRTPQTLADKVAAAIDLYPCRLLFVHRDADREDPELRHQEIRKAIAALADRAEMVPHVCVVPIRMTEAWLLIEESAIRQAAGNPNGTTPLELPSLQRIESIPDPKTVLRDTLRSASEMRGRRLKRFNEARCARLVSAYMRDFPKLRALSAFRRLEADVQAVVADLLRRNPS